MSKRLDEKVANIRTAVLDMEANPIGMVEQVGFVEYTKKFFRLCLTSLTGTEFVEKDTEEKLTGNKSLPKGSQLVEIMSLVDRFLAARALGIAELIAQARNQVREGKLTKEEFAKTYGSIIADDEAPKDVRVTLAPATSDKKLKVKGKELRQKIVDIMNDVTSTREDFEHVFRMTEAYRKRRKFWGWLIGGGIALIVVGGVTTAVIILANKGEREEDGDLDCDDNNIEFDLDAPPADVTIDDIVKPLAISFS